MLEKKWFQHIIALVVFLIVSMIFCRPVFEGKILVASDNLQTIASLKEADDNIRNTESTLTGWTGTMFSGMPVFRSLDPNRLVGVVYGLKQAEHSHSWDLLLWLMVSFYVLAMALGVSPWIGMFMSIAYTFTAFNIMSMEGGHFMKIFASGMVPGMLGGLIFLLKGKWLQGAMGFGLFLNLLMGINHTQITYYAMILAGITGLYYLIVQIRKGQTSILPKAFGIMAIALLLSIGSNIGIFHNFAAAEATTRGGQSELTANQSQGGGLDKDYAGSWSMDVVEIFTYLIPNFAGGPSSNYLVQDRNSNTYKALVREGGQQANQLAQSTSAYWGNQPFVGGGFYMGAALFFLFALYLFTTKDSKRIWLLISFVLLFLMALGKNFPAFFDLTFNHLPLYNKFRVPSMINLLIQLLIAAGAALGVQAVIRKEVETKYFYIAGGAILGFTVLLVFVSPAFFSFSSRQLAEQGVTLPNWLESALRRDRIALMQKDGIRSLIFMGLVAALIWTWLSGKLKSKLALIAGIGLVVCFDLIGNASRHLTEDLFVSKRKAYRIFTPTPADQQILADPDPHFRVFNLTRSPFNDAITSYHHKSIGGYHGAKLRRYQELIERHISRNNRAVLNMLNAKYFIVNGDQGPEARLNSGALGAAWFVDSLAVVTNGDAEMDGLGEGFRPGQYALIQERFAEGLDRNYTGSPDDQIRLTSYGPDRLVYSSNTSSERFAIFSEIYYMLSNKAGWYAYIDGTEVPIRKVNFTLRGLEIPAGQHEIVFEFKADKLMAMNNVRRGTSILTGIIILLLFGLWVKEEAKGRSVQKA